MRIVVLCLLIVLLPLRVWAAGTMAVAAVLPAAAAEAGSDCALHAAPAAEAGDRTGSDGGERDHGGQAHLLCDVCNVPAIVVPPPLLTLAAPAAGSAPAAAEPFASASLPPGVEPPIA